MNQSSEWNAPVRRTGGAPEPARRASEPSSLADILERVLDKGIVIAGDIQINLLDIELLTIKIRLLVASVDRAKEMGIDWWEHDPTLSSGARDVLEENERLRRRVDALEEGPGAREVDRGAEREDER
ncbi:gas vesicle protein [Streptomyces sp. PSAA01]|uniref:gas vesicle protein n=1 Tax=Streptomyces sp. PSAA01 TaxID=2912762 RepID=UPI001F1AE944|nr:gas vesicle protein [Streptomyces sp. PSAA01]MCG0285984.1 gas vesicle protein [Streptomyces sp. PSAA01]